MSYKEKLKRAKERRAEREAARKAKAVFDVVLMEAGAVPPPYSYEIEVPEKRDIPRILKQAEELVAGWRKDGFTVADWQAEYGYADEDPLYRRAVVITARHGAISNKYGEVHP